LFPLQELVQITVTPLLRLVPELYACQVRNSTRYVSRNANRVMHILQQRYSSKLFHQTGLRIPQPFVQTSAGWFVPTIERAFAGSLERALVVLFKGSNERLLVRSNERWLVCWLLGWFVRAVLPADKIGNTAVLTSNIRLWAHSNACLSVRSNE
jgi:hypothetical protein